MIGILIVTHGNLAREMVSAMEHVVGPQPDVDTVCIGASEDLEECRQTIIQKVEKLDSGSGVCILTDMFGGTPSNLSISVMNGRNVEVVAGLNLPMLIKMVREREKPLKELALLSAESGKKYINVASELL